MFIHDTPDFDNLRADHQDRHGLTIAYIKKRVGPGIEYTNEVAHAVLSDHGGYYQLAEMPEEFAGALGTGVSHRLVAPAEVRALLAHIEEFVEGITRGERKAQSISLYALYAGGSLRSRRSMFVFDQKSGEAPFAHGQWRPETLPRFLKLRLDCGEMPVPPALGFTQGVLFLLPPQNRDDGHALLATLARTPGTQDLSTARTSTMMH